MHERTMRLSAAVCALTLVLASAISTSAAIAQTGTGAQPAAAVDSVTPPPSAPSDTVAAPATPAPTPAVAPSATVAPAPATTPTPTAAPPPAAAPAPAAAPPPAATAPAPAAQATPPPASTSSGGPFARGKTRVTVTGGWGRSFTESYLLLGIGIGRYLKTGLDVGLDYEGWLLNDPTISKLTPGFRYVLTRSPMAKPFVGGFYRRTFVEGQDDLDSVGARLGVYRMGRASMVGVGAVWENYFDCDSKGYDDCTTLYPEFTFSKTF